MPRRQRGLAQAGGDRQLVIAGRDTPGNYVDRWTVFRIGYLPVLPTFVIFVVLLVVTNAFCTGGAYYRAIRRANGQPTPPLYAAVAGGKTLTLPISAIAYLVMTLVNVPVFVFTVAATLVTYAELRHREDSSITTQALAAEVPTPR